MGIYDSTLDLGIGPDIQKKLMMALAAILILFVVIAGAFWVSESLRPGALQIRFEKNPVKPSETTKLFVTVTNIDKNDAAAVPVTLEVKENTEFQVSPLNEKFTGTIELISAGASREIAFVANPVGNVLPGTYTFVAKATINGKQYEKEGTLKVEA